MDSRFTTQVARFFLLLLIAFQDRVNASDHYRVTAKPLVEASTSTSNQTALQVTIDAVDLRGTPLLSDTSTVALSGSTLGGGGIVISEIAGDGETVEFTNTGDAPVDVGGWVLLVRNRSQSPAYSPWTVLPGPTLVQPGQSFTWSSRPSSSGTFPTLRSPALLLKSTAALIEVRDSQWSLVDQVVLGSAYTAGSGEPLQWTPPGMLLPSNGSSSLLRGGAANHHSLADWSIGTSSLGTLNADLVVPATGLRTPAIANPSSVKLTDGTWTGIVQLETAGARRFVLSVDNGAGFLSESPLLTQPLDDRPQLTISGGPVRTREAAPQSIPLTVSIPKPEALPVSLALSVDAPGEYAIPTHAVIAPGSTFTQIVITNLDDSIADGNAVVHLTASASGYRSASLELINEDDELAGRLKVSTDSNARSFGGLLESTLLQSAPGYITVSQPSVHDVEILLRGNGRIRVPQRVVIPAGRASTSFFYLIEDDSVANLPSEVDEVVAASGTWPEAHAAVRIYDDESHRFTADLPTNLVEGTTNTCVLNFLSPRPADIELRVKSSGTWLQFPPSLRLPAGATNLSFPVTARDTQTYEGDRIETISIEDPNSAPDTAQSILLTLYDDEINPQLIQASIAHVLLTGDAIPVYTQLLNSGTSTYYQRTNAPFSLRFIEGSRASVVPPSNPLTLSNGLFSGTIRVSGESASAFLEVSSLGVTNRVGPLIVAPGRSLRGRFNAVKERPNQPDLLAVESETEEGTPASNLASIDPLSGARLRRLELPWIPSMIAVSASGSTAWLAAWTNRLLRVDLDSWRLTDEVILPSTNGTIQFLDMAVIPGTEDRLALIVGDDSPQQRYRTRLMGIRDGRTAVDGKIFSNFNGTVTAGPAKGEIYAMHDLVLERMTFDGTTFTSLASVAMPGSEYREPTRLQLVGDTLVLGNGQLRKAASLELVRNLDSSPSDLTPFGLLGGNRLLFVGANHVFTTTLDGSTSAESSIMQLPGTESGNQIIRKTSWGHRGLAYIPQDFILRIIESPFLPTGGADLSISIEAPARMELGPKSPQGGEAQIQVHVRNQGTTDAHYVELHSGLIFPSGVLLLGEIAAGSTRTVNLTARPSKLGPFSITASVTSSVEDNAPADNSTEVTMQVTPFLEFGETYLDLDARAGVVSKDHQWLYLANGPAGGQPGIAVVDAGEARVTRVLDVGGAVQRISISPDGNRLVGLRDDGQVIGWNLVTDSMIPPLDLAGARATDVAAIPGIVPRIAVAVTDGVLMYEESTHISVTPFINRVSTTNRSIGYVGTNLWVIDPIAAYELNPNKTGTPVVRKIVLTPSQSNTRFWYTPSSIVLPTVSISLPSGVLSPSSYDTRHFQDTSGTWFYISGTYVSIAPESSTFPFKSETRDSISAIGPLSDAWRVGADRFSVLGSSGKLLLFRSTIAQEKNAKLRMELVREGNPEALSQLSWIFRIINEGPDQMDFGVFSVSSGSLENSTLDGTPVRRDGTTSVAVSPIPSGQTREFRLTGTMPSYGSFQIYGSLSSDANPPPNSRIYQSDFVTPIYPPGDLAVSLEAPFKADVGRDFDVRCTVTNAGTNTIRFPFLNLQYPGSITLTSPGFRPNGDGGIQVIVNTNLPAGGILEFTGKARSTEPGIGWIQARTGGPFTDLNLGNNSTEVWIRTPSTDGGIAAPTLNLNFTSIQWLPARGLWLARHDSHVALLEPNGLKILAEWNLDTGVDDVRPTTSGRYAWFSIQHTGIKRLSLDTGDVDLAIHPYISTSSPSFVPIPGSDDAVVVIDQIPDTGISRVAIFDREVPRPGTVDGFPGISPGQTMSANSDGRIFVAGSNNVFELVTSPSGIAYSRTHNNGSFNARVEEGLVIAPNSFPFDLAPTNAVKLPILSSFNAGFAVERTEDRMVLWDLRQRQPVWATTVSSLNGYSRTAPAGTNGVLFLGPNGGFIPAPSGDNPDLTVKAEFLEGPPGFTNQIHMAKVDIGIAPGRAGLNARLIAELSPTVRPGPGAGTTNPIVIPLGHVTHNTSLQLPFLNHQQGPASIRFRVESDASDATPADNETVLAWDVPELPQMMVPDQVINSGGAYLKVYLTSPLPYPINLHVHVEADGFLQSKLRASDFDDVFPAFSTVGQIQLLKDPYELRPQGNLRVGIAQTSVPTLSASANVQVQPWSHTELLGTSISVFEGNTGSTTARLPVRLYAPLPYPLDFTVIPKSASALTGSDFSLTPIHLHFNPGQMTNYVEVAVRGDTTYELDETLTFEVAEAYPVPVSLSYFALTIRNDDPVPLPVVAIQANPSGEPSLSFESAPGKRYWVDAATNLLDLSWKPLVGPIIGNGAPWTGGVPTNSPAGYFRIRME